MKQLKFKPELVGKIFSGEKTSTWRLFDDKDLTVGNELEFLNSETREVFGMAKITEINIKTLGTLSDDDFDGHGKYSSEENMLTHFRNLYGDKVDLNSEVKLIDFDFRPNT